jgi:hypothetical protein
MSDGRHGTYYNSTNELASRIKDINDITSSNKLRSFMQNNANQIINNERSYFKGSQKCHPNIACSEGYHYVRHYQSYPPRTPNAVKNQWIPH